MQLVVLGMHRSGTSGVTRLLNMAGAYFGAPEVATDANLENPKGFWERRDVRAVCDGLLHGAGADWHHLADFDVDAIPDAVRAEQLAAFRAVLDDLDGHRPWVVKEPRLCLLLPVLRPVLTDPVCVHVTREPLEVAQSIHRRNDIPVQAALALWELYTLRAAEAARTLPAVHVAHHDLVIDPVRTVTDLVEQLGALGVTGLTPPADADVLDFISPELHRQRRSASDRGGRLNAEQRELAELAESGRLYLPTAAIPSLSEGARDELATIERVDRAEGAIDDLRRQADDARADADREVQRRRSVEQAALASFDTAEREVRAMVAGRPARLAAYLVAIRRTLTPGLDRRDPTPFSNALAAVDRGRRQVRRQAGRREDDVAGDPTPHRPVITRTRPDLPRTGRKRVAVLAWDVGHNPLGRANVLAEVLQRHFDVEMWGAQFERYGARVWAPLRDAPVPVNAFPGRPFPDHFAVMDAVAASIDADALWVSKPRLPSFLLGALAKERHGAPLVVDVDDHELAFFGDDEPLTLDELRLLPDRERQWPFERAWTRAVDEFIGYADQVTVSNRELQDRYGGLIVPHARDETVFDPDRVDRAAVRRRLGVGPDDRLLIFGGTPRLHKGVLEILQALEEIDDPRMQLLVFGTREYEEMRPQIGSLDRWVRALPYLPFEQLPEVIAAADLSCVLQDPTHPVARYQMPAKITDALAMGVPCLVRPTPPLRELIAEDVLGVVEPGTSLADAIRTTFHHPDDAQQRAAKGRKVFLASYSYQAVAQTIVPVFESLIADPPPIDERLKPLIDVPRELYRGAAGSASLTRTDSASVRRKHRPARPFAPGAPFDLVVFWKQNDTGIYGRRQDKVLEYLQRSGRVGTVVHFDNPLSPEALLHTWRTGGGPADQGRLVVRQTLRRLPGPTRRSGAVHHHTFLHGGSHTTRLGMPGRHGYARFVARTVADHGIGRDRPVVLWAYPTNTDLPLLIDTLDPDLVVSDVVDDNRTWFAPGSAEHDRADLNYEQVLGRSDVVFANCEPVAEGMRRFAPDITVVPNGLDLPDPAAGRSPCPPELARLNGPVIGYVGNLSSRLDLELVEDLVSARPAWQFVFIGSAHLDRSILELQRRPNVHFLGVKPAAEARRYVEHFDVALIPHLDNDMTQAMNPLKAFVYVAAGVPVVSTPIANIGHMSDLITIAHGAAGFLDAIETHLTAPRPAVDPARLGDHSWERRVTEMLARIDGVLAERTPPAGGDDLPGT